MNCKYCGAEYEDDLLQCPYCNSENEKEARERKEEILKSYDVEADKMKKEMASYPKKTANKWTKIILIILGCLLVIVIMVSVIVIVAGKLTVNVEYKIEQQQAGKLEEFLAAKDYDGMLAYIEEKDIWSGYDKYLEVKDVYKEYVEILKSKQTIEETTREYGKETWEKWTEYQVDWMVDSAITIYQYEEAYTQDKVLWGNEDEIEEIVQMAEKELLSYGLSEDEMDIIKEDSKDTDYSEILQKLQEYFWESHNANRNGNVSVKQ